MFHNVLRFCLFPALILSGIACQDCHIAWSKESTHKPNIVLVMCDDLGWGDVGFNGGKVIQTPNLDVMAKSSLRFTRFYAGSAVCSPTRGSVVTGRNPFRYGVYFANRGHMKPEELTLAELLKTIGYTTGHFGKWHLGTMTKTIKDSNRGGPRGIAHFSPPWINGFDVCFSTEAKVPTYDPMLKPRNANGQAWNYIQDKSSATAYGTYYWNQSGQRVTKDLDGDDSKLIMDRAIPFIESAVTAGKPFFTIIWFHAPHLPVVAGPEYDAMYADAPSIHYKNYYGCVTAMDQQIGRLRATLRHLGVAERTVVTFCSDNGPEGKSTSPGSAGPFRGRKRDLFEGGVRVPGLIEWPAKIRPGSVTDFPAVTSDYLPTVLDIVGIAMPDKRPIDGISLVPVFDGRLTKRPTPIAFQLPGKVALTGNRYKIVKYAARSTRRKKKKQDPNIKQQSSHYMLFDLVEDLAEKTDIAEQHPEIVTKMTATLDAWIKSCAASDKGADY